MRQLPVDLRLLELAMARHAEAEDTDTAGVWLDLDTGEIHWHYIHDEPWLADLPAGATPRARLEAQPERFVVVRACTRAEHRRILEAYLRSAWPMYRGRDGLDGWLADPRNRHEVRAFRAFRAHYLASRAERFLRSHGIVAG